MMKLNRRALIAGIAATAASPSILAASEGMRPHALRFKDRAMTDPKEIDYTLRKARVGSFAFVDGGDPLDLRL